MPAAEPELSAEAGAGKFSVLPGESLAKYRRPEAGTGESAEAAPEPVETYQPMPTGARTVEERPGRVTEPVPTSARPGRAPNRQWLPKPLRKRFRSL